MKTIVKGINSEIIIIPNTLTGFSLSFATETNTPIIERKNMIPEILKIQPYKTIIISPIPNNNFYFL